MQCGLQELWVKELGKEKEKKQMEGEKEKLEG
jgi:hypothetical protein